ncbi:MAG TPA: VOC family protein [Steroidobacteraceae bacterium]|nr:VOC family protein [Steroidobacteraceae bacterium]
MSNADIRGRFIWHELLTTDTAAAAAFYPRVLPWRTQPSSMPGYSLWMAGQTQIGGLTAQPPDASGTPPNWLIYVGTPSVDATCSQAQGLGAKVLKAPSDIPNVGRFAVLSDPQGATFAVFTPGAGSPPPGPQPTQGGFSWHELATTDVAGALRFYGELFGWRKGPGHDMGAMGVYQIFEQGGTQVGGMAHVQGPSSPPSWLSYVHVGDCGRAIASAKGAGGRLLHGPTEVPGGSWIALLMDPQGGAFAVQEAPRAAAAQARPAPTPAAAKPAGAPKPAAPPPAAAPKPAPPASTASAPASKPASSPGAASMPAAAKPAAKKAAKPRKKAPAKKRAAKRGPARKSAKKSARKAAGRSAPKKKSSKKKTAQRGRAKRSGRR